MLNPFDELFADDRKKVQPEPYEEVGGAMECQRGDCWEVATDGRYYYKEQTLRYTCPAGHENECEGISI